MDVDICPRNNVLVRLKSETGETLGSLVELPIDITVDKLQLICNGLLGQEEEVPYLFFVNETEIKDSLKDVIENEKIGIEDVIEIVYQQQAIFKVYAVTRCTSSIPGHAEAVISVNFSPCGRFLASGSGDTTVRFWDVATQTPHYTCKGHNNWVLCISWSPDGSRLASGCKNGHICLWDPNTGKQLGKTLSGHRQWITALSWEPYHRNPECQRLASGSKDGSVIIWNVIIGNRLLVLSGHTGSVTDVRWGGNDLIYSSSQDKNIKVWRASDGVLCRTLEGHAHWVNSLTLSTDYVLRTGCYDPIKGIDSSCDKKALLKMARERYESILNSGGERLVSGSDDFTLFLWHPEQQKKPISRMTGHQQLVNDVKFSPDGRLIASASFDKSLRLWDGQTGKYITVFRGHVQAVYQVSWSADSRLLVSSSADSTLKVWEVRKKKILYDLPGHADEVFAVDWSPDGLKVASGGKDKVLKLWQR